MGSNSRTIVGSVVCVDLVGFSTRSVAQQGAIKSAFNQLLAEVIRRIPPADRLILDTGDGVAITFLGDPEGCLDVGLRLLDVMNDAAMRLGVSDPAGRPVRIALNLGSLKLTEDLNGHPNIIGDGISVAERIVAFAQPGQIIASRSFQDAVSRISDGNAKLFRHEGVHADKDGREHHIYLVEPLPSLRKTPAADDGGAARPSGVARSGVRDALLAFLRDRRKVAIAVVASSAVIAGEAWMLQQKRAAASVRPSAAAALEVPLKVSLYSRVVDQQDTNAYFKAATCPVPFHDGSRLRPDKTDGSINAWDQFPGSPWKAVTKLSSGLYDDGQDCKPNGGCLRAEFSKDGKVLSLDTRHTSPLRKVTVDFGLPSADASPPPFGPHIATAGLLEISALNPITSMIVCSSSGCPEARQIAAKFWFADPSDSKVNWRVDWGAVRVLRLSPKAWYFIADACGGSQYTSLSKLVGEGANRVETSLGHFLIPLFFSAELR
jgi:class 3 adenylate cyclase